MPENAKKSQTVRHLSDVNKQQRLRSNSARF